MTPPLGAGQSILVESLKKLGKLTAVGSCREILGRDNARQAGLSPGLFNAHHCGQVSYSYKRRIGWKQHGKNGYEPEKA
jgi:hypothetical protein